MSSRREQARGGRADGRHSRQSSVDSRQSKRRPVSLSSLSLQRQSESWSGAAVRTSPPLGKTDQWPVVQLAKCACQLPSTVLFSGSHAYLNPPLVPALAPRTRPCVARCSLHQTRWNKSARSGGLVDDEETNKTDRAEKRNTTFFFVFTSTTRTTKGN